MSIKGDLARHGIVTDATKNNAVEKIKAGNLVVPPSSGLAALLQVHQDPLAFAEIFDDFFAFVETAGTNKGGWWPVAIGSGVAAGHPIVSATPGANGNVLWTTAGANGDGLHIPWEVLSFLMASGRKFWFFARVQFLTVVTLPVRFGIIANSTDPFAADANGIYFNINETAGKTGTIVKNAGGTTETADHSSDVVADTYYECGFYYDGSQVQFYKDRDELGDPVTTNIPVGITLQPFIASKAASVAALTVAFDYVRVITERA